MQLAALMRLAAIEKYRGRNAAAFRRLRAAERCVERLRLGVTSEESRLAFGLDKGEVYAALISNRLERGDSQAVRQALVFAERGKARALAERLAEWSGEVLGSSNPATHRLLARLTRLERQLSLAESRLEDDGKTPGIRGARASQIEALTGARQTTLRRLSKHDPPRGALAGGVPDTPLAVIDALRENERVLEYAEADGHFHLFLVDRHGVEAFPELVRVDRVRDAVDLLRFQLGKGVLGDDHAARFGPQIVSTLRAHLARLHELLLDPVADRLQGMRVRIVPHGILHGLPFHALERDGIPLIDRCILSYAPSLAVMDLLARRTAGNDTPPLILGIADKSAPFIEDEVQAVRRHLPRARVFRGERATSEAVELGRSRPSLMHVACHGFYSEKSSWTGALRLGDSWLTLPEVYGLEGTAELVVLSGCNTGRGTVYSGDEWVGLVRGFLQAGARSVMASLWEVHDHSAVGMMDDFYGNLAGGCDVAESLALAQRKARRVDALPLRWAPFMVIGDPYLRLALGKAA